VRQWSTIVAVSLLMVSCNNVAGPAADVRPASVQRYVDDVGTMSWRSQGVDTWEVWICDVPPDATSAVFAATARVTLEPAEVVAELGQVSERFTDWSSGVYQPVFVAGGRVVLAHDAEPQSCSDTAITRAADTTRGVLVVATAQHRGDQPGGWSSGGDGCDEPCAPSRSGRYIYVGAADFVAAAPLLDLVEHEMGHALGWWHSAYDPLAQRPYRSNIDLMSNSAGARAGDPLERHAPPPIGAHLLMARWPGAEVVPIDDTRFATIDRRPDGTAVHLVDVVARTIEPVHTTVEPYTDLLAPGETITVGGVTVTV
jgi:hypothetical protein